MCEYCNTFASVGKIVSASVNDIHSERAICVDLLTTIRLILVVFLFCKFLLTFAEWVSMNGRNERNFFFDDASSIVQWWETLTISFSVSGFVCVCSIVNRMRFTYTQPNSKSVINSNFNFRGNSSSNYLCFQCETKTEDDEDERTHQFFRQFFVHFFWFEQLSLVLCVYFMFNWPLASKP